MPYHTIHVIFWTRFPKSSFNFAMSEQLLSSTLPHQKHQWPVAPVASGCVDSKPMHEGFLPLGRLGPTLSTFFLPGIAPFQVDQRLLFDPHSCSMVADPHLSIITHTIPPNQNWLEEKHRITEILFWGDGFWILLFHWVFSPNEVSHDPKQELQWATFFQWRHRCARSRPPTIRSTSPEQWKNLRSKHLRSGKCDKRLRFASSLYIYVSIVLIIVMCDL